MTKHVTLPIVGVAVATLMLWQTPAARAQHAHGHGHGHGQHGHHHGHEHQHGHGHIGIHLGHHHVLSHFDNYHHGTYWVDSGICYYQPRTYVIDLGSYVAAKPVVVEFGGFSHVDDLAGRLEQLANDLCLDMHYNYSHNPGFQETYSEAYQMLETAKFLHANEHQRDPAEVARLAANLDPLLHHVQSDIRNWSRRSHRQVGQVGIKTKMKTMESLLHHLMNDVGVRPHEASATEVAPPPQTGNVTPPLQPATITTPPPATLQ